jgi:hypothetical protein
VALTVETGQAASDADSYVSLTDAAAHHTAFGNAAWAALASDTVREQYLRRATQHMVQEYRTRWAGSRKTTTQALDWPRYDVPIKDAPSYFGGGWQYGIYYSSDTVPREIGIACAELALRAIDGPLTADLEASVKREKVGPIETEYVRGSATQTRFEAVDNLLRPFLRGTAGTLWVERA